MIACELLIRLALGVAAAERDDTNNVRILHEIGVEIVDARDGELEHELCASGELGEILLDDAEHDLLCHCLIGAVDIDLGLEDGDEPLRDDVLTERKLLVDDGADAVGIGLLDDGAHLRPEDVTLICTVEECAEPRDGLHELNAVRLGREPLVDLQDGDDALLLPEIVGRVEPVDLAVHRVLKENGGKDLALVECGALDDARTHLVNARKHLLVAVVGALVDAVCLQRFRRRAAALIECGDKALIVLHAGELLLIHGGFLLVVSTGWRARAQSPSAPCLSGLRPHRNPYASYYTAMG